MKLLSGGVFKVRVDERMELVHSLEHLQSLCVHSGGWFFFREGWLRIRQGLSLLSECLFISIVRETGVCEELTALGHLVFLFFI